MRFKFHNQHELDLWNVITVQDDVVTIFYKKGTPKELSVFLPVELTKSIKKFVHDNDSGHEDLHEVSEERDFFHHHFQLNHAVQVADLKKIIQVFSEYAKGLLSGGVAMASSSNPINNIAISFMCSQAVDELLIHFTHHLIMERFKRALEISKIENYRKGGQLLAIQQTAVVITEFKTALSELSFAQYPDLRKIMQSALAGAYVSQIKFFMKIENLEMAIKLCKEFNDSCAHLLEKNDSHSKAVTSFYSFLQNEEPKEEKERFSFFRQKNREIFPEEAKEIIDFCKLNSEPKNAATLEKALRRLASIADVKKLEYLMRIYPIDVNAKDNGKWHRTALHWAVLESKKFPNRAKDYIHCIELLVLEGAEDIPDASSKKPSDYVQEDSLILSALKKPILSYSQSFMST